MTSTWLVRSLARPGCQVERDDGWRLHRVTVPHSARWPPADRSSECCSVCSELDRPIAVHALARRERPPPSSPAVKISNAASV